MDHNNLVLALAIVCVGFFILDGFVLIVNNVQNIIYDRRNQKRDSENAVKRAKQDEEYHQKLMEMLKK